MGFVFVRKSRARALRRQLARRCRWTCTTSGLHGEDDAVALHAADARRRGVRRGARRSSSPRAASRRGSRATRATARRSSTAWRELGFVPFLDPAIQAPIIVTFHAPADPRYDVQARSTTRVRDKGFILYPGKLTQVETFRVGCIGAIGPDRDGAGRRGGGAARWRSSASRSGATVRSQRSTGTGATIASMTTPNSRAPRPHRRSQERQPARSRSRCSDIDGILRGKYLHKDKFESAVEGGFGFCDVVFGWDCHDSVLRQHDAHRLAQGLSRRARAHRPRHASQRAVGRRRRLLPRRVRRTPDGRRRFPLCPRQVLKRVLEARREARLHADVRHRVRVVQLHRDAADRGPTSRASDPTPLTPGMFGYSLLRANQIARVLQGADRTRWRAFGVPIEGLHTETGPGVYEAAILFSRGARSRRPRRCCSRPAPRRSARASASCRASWRSGASNLPGCSGHMPPDRCPTARRTCSTTPRAGSGMSKLFESYLAGPGRAPAGVRADVLADDQQLQAAGRRLLGAGEADVGRRQPHGELPRDRRDRRSRRGSRRAARARTSTRTSRWPRASPRASTASRRT